MEQQPTRSSNAVPIIVTIILVILLIVIFAFASSNRSNNSEAPDEGVITEESEDINSVEPIIEDSVDETADQTPES